VSAPPAQASAPAAQADPWPVIGMGLTFVPGRRGAVAIATGEPAA
jgi:hypothetical protein